VHRGTPPKENKDGKEASLPPVYAREHYDSGNPVGGLRVATNAEDPWVEIKAGTFDMGDTYYDAKLGERVVPTSGEREGKEGAVDETPVHELQMDQFSLYRSEIPFVEWRRVKQWADQNGYGFTNQGYAKGPEYPVTKINWFDALKWCNARSEMEGRRPFYYRAAQKNRDTVFRTGEMEIAEEMVDWSASGYRLPTEAEWEKAAKADNPENRYSCGKQIGPLQAVYQGEQSSSSSSGGRAPTQAIRPHPVFGNAPAPARTHSSSGIYNMTGNVWEWCWDTFAPYPGFAKDGLPININPNIRTMRGGSWRTKAWECRSSRRGRALATKSADDVGFRIVRP
jgi:formylglycine-generating enzyme required for sulfatase activity